MNAFSAVSRTVSVVTFAGVCSVFAAPAAAQTTANLAVSASVAGNCTIATNPVAFGAYDAVIANSVTPLTAVGAVKVACTYGTTPNVSLNDGTNYSGTRQMKAGSDYLSYELYQDAGRVTIWNSTPVSLGAAPNSTERSFPVYGRIPAAQQAPVGSYADTVVATWNF